MVQVVNRDYEWCVGDTCYSTLESPMGKGLHPGSKGRVIGPSTNPALSRADEKVFVEFENGMRVHMFAKNLSREVCVCECV